MGRSLPNANLLAQDRSAHLAGIGLMLLATLMFSLNDTLGKWLVATYSVAQILLLRAVAALIILSPFIVRAGLDAFRKAPQPRLQVLRALLATTEVACFYFSVWYLPLADAMTFYLAGPIYVTAMSALFLGERVGIYRWGAVLVGFVGVLIALNPTLGTLGIGSLIALVGSFIYAIFIVTTRQVRNTSNVVLATAQALGGLTFGTIGSPLGWVPVESGSHYLLLFLLGAVSIVAISCVNQSLRLAPASVVVPYQYALIVFAIIFGYIFFGDAPRLHTLIGAAIIVASGLFIFLREQRLKVPTADEPALAER
jgi:drug/metabolite transporter (DMT)-like permease